MENLENKQILLNGKMPIIQALELLKEYKFVIPTFQRKFEWSMEKIECLWDSILQDFPISTFLFWKIDSNNTTPDTDFYHVFTEVDYKGNKNKTEVSRVERSGSRYSGIEECAILDGQQRLTSLYLSLMGNIFLKQKNDNSRYSCDLVIELDKNKTFDDEYNEDNENSKFNKKEIVWKKKYDIKFTTQKSLPSTTFRIKRIIEEKEIFQDPEKRKNAIETTIATVPNNSKDYAREILNKICSKVFDEEILNYTMAVNTQQEDSLEMFVRFNSGGKPLTVAQITSSILQVYWSDAETKFDKILSELSSSFNYDFILRTAHMLWGDVVKSNINTDLVENLRNNWDTFCSALKNLKALLETFNINIEYFAKRWNVLLPVVYEIYNNPNYTENSQEIRTYIIRAVLFGYFKNGTTGKLSILGKRIKNQDHKIILADLDDIPDLRVTQDKIDTILDSEYKNRTSGEALFFLSLNWNKNYDCAKDHMHPKSSFSTDTLNVTSAQINKWSKMYNKLPNLQYLLKSTNERKNGRPLRDWLETETDDKEKIMERAYIPQNVSLAFENFEEFYTKRREILKEKLYELLEPKNTSKNI